MTARQISGHVVTQKLAEIISKNFANTVRSMSALDGIMDDPAVTKRAALAAIVKSFENETAIQLLAQAIDEEIANICLTERVQ